MLFFFEDLLLFFLRSIYQDSLMHVRGWQVEQDRIKMSPMITDLIAQIAKFQPLDMLQLEVFVLEVERRLSLLSDERMVLKAFDNWVTPFLKPRLLLRLP